MDELKDCVRGLEFFTGIGLENGYLVRIEEGGVWETEFRCNIRYGLIEYLVMPFGLMNAPATFQAVIGHIFRDILDQGTIALMDDPLVRAHTKDKHGQIVPGLQENRLCIAPDKCEW